MRAISSGEEAAPPIMMWRMLERSKRPSSGQCSSALAMVGTSVMPVAFSSWMSRSTWAGSKRRTITWRSPIMVEDCATPPAVGVEQRDGVQLHLAVAFDKAGDIVQRVQVQGAVREHHALGRAGGAAGVEQLGDGGLVDAEEIGALHAAAGQQVFVRPAGGDPVRNGIGRRPQRLHQRLEIRFVDHHPRRRRVRGWRSVPPASGAR